MEQLFVGKSVCLSDTSALLIYIYFFTLIVWLSRYSTGSPLSFGVKLRPFANKNDCQLMYSYLKVFPACCLVNYCTAGHFSSSPPCIGAVASSGCVSQPAQRLGQLKLMISHLQGSIINCSLLSIRADEVSCRALTVTIPPLSILTLSEFPCQSALVRSV